MTAAMEGSYANVHRGLHTLANETTEAYEAARESVAALHQRRDARRDRLHQGRHRGDQPGRRRPRASAAGRRRDRRLRDGAPRQHRALALPARAQGRGAEVRAGARRRLAGHGRPMPRLLGPKTKLVAVTPHVQRAGHDQSDRRDRRRSGPRGRGAGAARRLPGRRSTARVDVQALDCDFYVFSGHKLYGPTGIGVLYGKAERLAALPPYQGGGEMIGTVTDGPRSPTPTPPHRFEAGTPPILEAIGLGAAIDWLIGVRPRRRSPPTSTPSTTACVERLAGAELAADHRRRRRARARSSPSPSRAPTPTTWPRSWTATASPCAPAPTAPSP